MWEEFFFYVADTLSRAAPLVTEVDTKLLENGAWIVQCILIPLTKKIRVTGRNY